MTPAKETPAAQRHQTQQITTHTDSREILANAKRDIERYNLHDYYIVDVDSHHVSSTPGAKSWITSRIPCCAATPR